MVGCCLWGHTELDTTDDWWDLAAAAAVNQKFKAHKSVRNGEEDGILKSVLSEDLTERVMSEQRLEDVGE